MTVKNKLERSSRAPFTVLSMYMSRMTVILHPTQGLEGAIIARWAKPSCSNLLEGKQGNTNADASGPLTQSLKTRTFLSPEHPNSICVPDAASFPGGVCDKPPEFIHVFLKFSASSNSPHPPYIHFVTLLS
jgi:hypothetical protein